MHLKLVIAGKSLSILSRVGPAGLDYSGRTNKYGHHVVLDPSERPSGGPAWLLSQPGFMQDAWHGEPRVLEEGSRPPRGDRPPAIAHAWQAATGDGGWAGALAEAFLADPGRAAVIVFRPGVELLPLFVEAIALLPQSKRWDVEFSTFYSTLPPGVTCSWRGVVDGSAEAEAALRLPGARVINLCGPMPRAAGRALVQHARTGEAPDASALFDEPPIANPAGGRAPVSNSPDVAPTSRVPRSYETVPPLGVEGGNLGPPSLPALKHHIHKPSRNWFLVSAGALGLAGVLVAAMLLLHPDGGTKIGSNNARSQPASSSTDLEPNAIAAVPRAATPPKGLEKPASGLSGAIEKASTTGKPAESTDPIASATGSGGTSKPKTGATKEASHSKKDVAVGPDADQNAIAKSSDQPEGARGSPTPALTLKPDMVLEFIIKERGKESVLELPSSARGPALIKRLGLNMLKKPSKSSGKSLRVTAGAAEQPALEIIAAVEDRFGSNERAIAHFKAGGPKVTLNWDPAVTDEQADSSRELLRSSILEITTDRNETLYAVFSRRPAATPRPVEIPPEIVEDARSKRKQELTLDVPWELSQDPHFVYLQNRLVLLRMKAFAKGSTKMLPLVESEKPGQWICKGKALPTLMTVSIKESDNKLRFVFPRNPYFLEAQLAKSKRPLSNAFKEGSALDPKEDVAESDAPPPPKGLEDDLHLCQSLLAAQYRFAVGFRVDDKGKIVDLIPLDEESAPEKTPQ